LETCATRVKPTTKPLVISPNERHRGCELLLLHLPSAFCTTTIRPINNDSAEGT
jgi:hypothetical protein